MARNNQFPGQRIRIGWYNAMEQEASRKQRLTTRLLIRKLLLKVFVCHPVPTRYLFRWTHLLLRHEVTLERVQTIKSDKNIRETTQVFTSKNVYFQCYFATADWGLKAILATNRPVTLDFVVRKEAIMHSDSTCLIQAESLCRPILFYACYKLKSFPLRLDLEKDKYFVVT